MLNVSSVLDSVTVFSQGALCTRIAQLSGAPPESRVRLTGLPLLLKPASLRASIRKGPAGVIVRDVRPELDVEQVAETDVPKEQKELEAAEAALEKTQVELQLVTGKVDALKRLDPVYPTPAKGAPPRPSAASAILELAAFVDKELEPLQARLFELQELQTKQIEEVQLRKQRISEASAAVRLQRTRISRAAVITLSEGTGNEPLELILEYVVMAARWSPAYELDLDRGMNSGVLKLRANVMQRTGEDWNDVRLSLSTANLERRADAPELKSLRIGRRQQAPARSGWREPPPGLDELFGDFDAAIRKRPVAPVDQLSTRAGSVKGHVLDAARAMGGVSMPMSEAAADRPLGGSMPPAELAAERAPRRPPTGAFPVVNAPPPPPMAPANFAAPGGAPAALGSAQAIPMPARARAAPAPKTAKRASMQRMADMGMDDAPSEDMEEGFGGAMRSEPEAPAALEVDKSLLDYDGLELAAPEAPGRGHLRKRAGPPRHDLLFINMVQVQVNVVSIMAVLEQQASQAMAVPLPRYSVVPREAAAFFDHKYDVAHRTSLVSDGAWHALPVFNANVAMEAEYLTVPSVEPRAFRTVLLTNKTAHALLAGPVDVRLGGEFLMTSPFPTSAPGATQRLGLGVEESIKVSRNTRFDEATGGVFGGATMLTHGVEVEVANRLPHPITVDVRERVPAIPQGEKDIKVDESEVRPPWSKPKELPGAVPVEGERTWRVQLKAGETQKLVANWVVKIPASKMLSGGNRRA